MEQNKRGNEIYRDFEADAKLGEIFGLPASQCRGDLYDGCRYFYDFELLSSWRQFDTWQDASYFGVWVEVQKRLTFTYAEGDRTLVVCPTVESFKAELADAARFYGPPPAAATAIGGDGSVAEYFDERPTGDPDQVFGKRAIVAALEEVL